MSGKRPSVACMEEFDSDRESVRPNTRVEAKRAASQVRPSTRPGNRDAASDSGYSSHHSAKALNGIPDTSQSSRYAQPATRPAPSNQAKPRPMIHRSESQRNSSTRPPSRPPPVERSDSVHCGDPGCFDPRCPGPISVRRRDSTSSKPSTSDQYPVQVTTVPNPQYDGQYRPVIPSYNYPQVNATQMVPTLNPQPRPRTGSTSRGARPVSWAGGNYSPAEPYQTKQQGPPPSPSAYARAWHQERVDTAAYYDQQRLAATHQAMANLALSPANYMASPGMVHQPPPPAETTAASLTNSLPPYSARYTNPGVAGYGTQPMASAPPTRTFHQYSTRTAGQRMPGAFPGESPISDYEAGTISSSESEDSEIVMNMQRKRDSKLMPPPEMRPSMRHSYTMPSVSRTTSREPYRRTPRSDNDLELSSSDNFDSDRTAYAVVDRRTYSSGASSSRSRRPSVSTSASSGATKATTLSNGSGSGRYIVEDNYGRRKQYQSREQHDAYMRQEQQQQQKIEAYQAATRGGLDARDLSATAYKRSHSSQDVQYPRSSSRMSGHSRKSSHSSKMGRSNAGSEGIQITTGDTTLQVVGDAKIEVRAGINGAEFIIGGSSRREPSYYASSSKSSGSRIGRSRGGSDTGRRKDFIREEDGYEPGM